MKEFYNAVEAAREIGVSEKTISRRLKKIGNPFPHDKLHGYQIPASWVESQPEWTSTRPPGQQPDTAGHAPDDMPDRAGDSAPDTSRQPSDSNSKEAPNTPRRSVDNETLNEPDATAGHAPVMSGGEMVVHLAAVEHHAGEPDGITAEEFFAAMQEMIESNRELRQANQELSARVEQLEQAQAGAIQALTAGAKEREEQTNAALEIVAQRAAEAALAPIQKAQETLVADNQRLQRERDEALEKSRGFWAKLFGKG